jgi:hypothetical protein
MHATSAILQNFNFNFNIYMGCASPSHPGVLRLLTGVQRMAAK